MLTENSLCNVMFRQLGQIPIEREQLPLSISQNLNPRFPLRPYQERAFKYFRAYWEQAFEGKPRYNHQLLFHMATGSGKTLVMAGLIPYLFEQGYRKFLFFVNSTNIIEKTRGNFLTAGSPKYLFAPTLSIGDRHIEVREVQNFQAVAPDAINIVFTTIQKLHGDLTSPREDGVTYDDFETDRIVLISDEAHHINATTMQGRNVAQGEFAEVSSWENTVERVFRSHRQNVLLEFTATLDLTNEELARKYEPRHLFDYPLREFRKDGYSKEVKVLQTDNDPFSRALQAVILSQYRRKVFEQHRQFIKPVLLFKSKTIPGSKGFLDTFVNGIKELTLLRLQSLKDGALEGSVLARAFAFFDRTGVTLPNLVTELQDDFSEDKLIEVNSKDESEEKQLAVNTLETNGYRAVFAVDKLNEGWDVLNLFDIVRMYDTRDSSSGVGKTTMSEAQLIGRGARYCPFRVEPGQPLYERKYDADLTNELRVCEELYYHSAHNPKYIQELNLALKQLGMKASNTQERSIKLKPSFRETDFYRTGLIFLNQRVRRSVSRLDFLGNGFFTRVHEVALHTGFSKATVVFDEVDNPAAGTVKNTDGDRGAAEYALLDFGLAVLRKATQRIEFFAFDNLRAVLPQITSMTEFFSSSSYLGALRVAVTGRPQDVVNLTPDQKLWAATQVLELVAGVLAKEKVRYEGTREFTRSAVQKVFTDKTLNFMLEGGEDKEFGRSMCNLAETAYHLDLSTREWYAFDDCFGTSEEKLLIKYIDRRYEDLKRFYSQVYLLRNEKHFQLYTFEDGRPLEPDFVLFLVGKAPTDNMQYQVFIEPKGKHLLHGDAWKEAFLESIKSIGQAEQLIQDKNYVVWGLPFFNETERMSEFEDGFKELLQ